MPIAVTGIGAVSIAGPDTSALLAMLKTPRRLFVPTRRHPVEFDVIVGEADDAWFGPCGHPELDSPTGRLCLEAASECVTHATANGADRPDGLVLGTSTGGQSRSEEVVFSLIDGRPPGAYDFKGQGCMAAPSRLVARALDIPGPVTTLSTACTSSANAIALGAAWIRSGRCRRVLAGGGDALCYTTISSFHILELTGPNMCSPFGQDRPGLTLGEGAGFVMLEPLEDVRARGGEPLALYLGAGMSSDAYHMTAPPPDGSGAELAMQRAVTAAGIDATEVAHVNAHGTGTQLNDAAEAAAIARLFGDQVPVMSCKGLLGHTLGGAGGVEAVISVMSIVNGRIFESLGSSPAGEDCPIALVGSRGGELKGDAVVVSNSFAFGGNNCSLVFRGPQGC